MRYHLALICAALASLSVASVASAADYYWTGQGTLNAHNNLEWSDPNNWNLDGYATGTIPASGPTLGTSPGPYDNVFLTSSSAYLGGITASSGTYQRVNNLTVDGGFNRIGGRYTTDNPDLRVEGDFTVAAGAQFFTGPYSPNRIDCYGAFTVGNGSIIGINNNNSDSGYWNLANATSISLGGTTILDMTNNWQWNPPRWDFGTATITLTNTNEFNLEQDVVNGPRSGVDSRGALQLTINNTITGTGGITKTGAATLILNSASSDYSGATTIDGGILQANGGGAIGDLSAVVLANAQSSANQGSVKATLSLGASETIGSLAGGGATGGNVILNGHTLTVGGNGASTTFAGVIAGSATGPTQGPRTNQSTSFTGEPYAPEGHLYAPEPALGAGSLVKIGAGTLELTAANLYTGTTTVSEGVLRISHANALGDTTGGTVVDPGPTLHGARIEISGGITVAEPITITGFGVTWGGALSSVSGTNTYSGPITVANSARIGVQSTNDFTITGGITGGSVQFVGNNSATIRIADNPINIASNNLYAVDNSIVLLDVGGNTWGNTTIAYNGTLKLGLDDVMPTTTVVTIGSATPTSGTLDLNGHNQTIAGLQDAGFSSRRVINGGAGTPTLTVNNSADYTYGGLLGTAGQNEFNLVKQGDGQLTLAADNTYAGTTSVQGGVLTISAAGALGATSDGTTVSAGAQLRLTGGFTFDPEPLTISGNGNNPGVSAGRGALRSASGDNVWTGPIVIAGTGETWINANGGTLTLTGGVTGTDAKLRLDQGSMTVTTNPIDLGAGGVLFVNSSSLLSVPGNVFGTLQIDWGGNLKMGAADVLPANVAVRIGTSGGVTGTLDLNGYDQMIGQLADGGSGYASETVTNSQTAPATLTINQSADSRYRGNITGNLALTKDGGGTLTLGDNTLALADNSYTGATIVRGGTLALETTGTNSIPHSSQIVVGDTPAHNSAVLDVTGVLGGFQLGAAQTLSGFGTVLGDLTVLGTHAPGASPGIQTVNGDYTLDSAGTLQIEIQGTAPGTGYDQLIVNGAVDLAGDLDVQVSGYATGPDDLFWILLNDGTDPITGQFAGIDPGAPITLDGRTFYVYYDADYDSLAFTGGNDVLLTSVPEPSTLAMLAGLIGLGLAGWMRRRAGRENG